MAAAFELAALTGFEGVEIMVGMDAMSQDSTVLRNLVQHYQLPILSLHAPCLLVTQRVWGTDSWGKLDKAREVAELVGAETVVVHPPFRWQRDYAKNFEALEIKALVVEGQLLDGSQIDVLASLPSREEALTLIAAVLQAPIGKFATLLNEVPSKLARVLSAVRDNKQANA